MSYHVAVDIGASSGRLVLATVDNQNTLYTEEVHRFKNGFEMMDGFERWNVNKLFEEILIGLEKVKKIGVSKCTLGIDTWAVDYCLIDEDGELLSQPISYRDNRTENALEKVARKITKEQIYQKTGIQFQNFNTLFQLFTEDPKLLERTATILLIPDYLAFCLTGKRVGEITNFSTTQLLNVEEKEYDFELLEMINVSKNKFPNLIQPGNVLGSLKAELQEKFDLPSCKIISVATHDTASAVVGVPTTTGNWAYLSSGTWSLIGIEDKVPIINSESLKANFSNEWGAYGTYRFLKNITGMWCVQEIARAADYKYSFSEMADEAYQVEPFLQYVDLNDTRFTNPGNMIEEIQNYCIERKLVVPQTIGELTMCVYSNLALAYAHEWRQIEKLTNKKLDCLHIVGGGSNVKLLNQLTADVIGKKVIAGPNEATAIGNILVQLIAEGTFNDLKEARLWLSSQIKLEEYKPKQISYREHLKKYEKEIKKELSV